MNDMRPVIVPKSDQINAEHLLAGPMTITVSNVSIRPGTEQPVSIHFDGDNGKPYKPCKSMCKVMVACWGPDANEYVGRSMTLYCDPNVKWGGMAVGGIRISHLSDLEDDTKTMALTETKGKKQVFKVRRLKVEPKKTAEDPAAKASQWVSGKVVTIKKSSAADLRAWTAKEDVKRYRATLSPDLAAMLDAAIASRLEELSEGVPSDDTSQDEAA